ncbi:MAG TPA: hypothetical protein VFT54_01480 [Acidimicrobiia bacterium]|nr:hypothetical protein [Acidimicrobiia bacterium]
MKSDGARTALAVGAFLLTSLTNVTAPLFAAVAIYATIGLFNRPTIVREKPSSVFGAVVLLALVVGGLLVEYPDLPFGDPLALTLWLSCAAVAVAVPIWSARTGDARSLFVLLGVLLVITSFIGARLILSAQDRVDASDVFAFHEAATKALQEGESPYAAARVLNTDPNVAPGTISTGYPYPPISMAPLVVSSALFGDSRWVLLASWVGVIAVLGTRAIASGGALFQSVLLLGLFPGFRITLFVGWTEPLLMGVASLLVLGNSEPGRLQVWRTAVLGALASSKQYMVFLAPLVLVVRSLRIPLSLSAVGLTAATLIPFLLIDPRSVYHALYENLAVIGDRPDSFSISGMLQTLGLTTGGLPRLLWIAMTLIFGYLIARRIRDLSDFILGTAMVLGFAFLIGVAFVNYWLLCAGLVLVGSIMKASQSAA